MRLILATLLLLLSLSALGQVYYTTTGLQSANTTDRPIYASKYNAVGGAYFSVSGDSISQIATGASFEGVSYTFKKQTKETLRLYLKINLKRLGATTSRVSYGLILWKDGARVQFTDAQFTATSLTYCRFFPAYTTTGEKVLSNNINFATLPSYDSMEVHVAVYYSGAVGGSGAYATWNINDCYLSPIKNSYGVLLYSQSSSDLGFLPAMFMPDTIYIAEGNSIDIYNDNVTYIPVPQKSDLTFTWTSTIGSTVDSALHITEAVAGTYSAKLVAYYNSVAIDSASMIIKVEPKVTIDTLVICAIGNSLTGGGWTYMSPVLRDSIDITEYITTGTQGSAGNENEGRSGWTYATFLGATSPFYVGGNLDFVSYINDSISDYPDVFRINLGINDCYALIDVQTTINRSMTLIDAILSQTNSTVVICMPSSASNTYAGWLANYGNTTNYEEYVVKIMELRQRIWQVYGGNRYSARVYVGYDGFVIDRSDGYPKTAGIHTNAVHPSSDGYKQLINGTLNVVNHIYQ